MIGEPIEGRNPSSSFVVAYNVGKDVGEAMMRFDERIRCSGIDNCYKKKKKKNQSRLYSYCIKFTVYKFSPSLPSDMVNHKSHRVFHKFE